MMLPITPTHTHTLDTHTRTNTHTPSLTPSHAHAQTHLSPDCLKNMRAFLPPTAMGYVLQSRHITQSILEWETEAEYATYP